MGIKIYNSKDFEKMRNACKISRQILDKLTDFVKVGITTNDINDFVHQETLKAGGIPAPLNYKSFPKSVCTSLNDVICHGIPDNTKLKDGDILNIDVTTILEGYYGDMSRMYTVGESFLDDNQHVEKKLLIKTTYEAMMKGIAQAKPGNRFIDIASAIQNHAHKFGFSVVRDFCGHGVGKNFHEEPNVLHYVPKDKELIDFSGMKTKLKPGMIFTVEPMINAGSWEAKIDKDGWTARTRDGSLSAQFELTIGITKEGNEIF